MYVERWVSITDPWLETFAEDTTPVWVLLSAEGTRTYIFPVYCSIVNRHVSFGTELPVSLSCGQSTCMHVYLFMHCLLYMLLVKSSPGHCDQVYVQYPRLSQPYHIG